MYGRVDVGYNQQKTTVSVANVGAWTKANNLVNEDGLSTGLLGFKGEEDLGGGLKASFVQEMDLDLDTGTLITGPGRNSTLGLSGGFGNFRMGRSYTPLFSTIGMSDPFGTTGAGAVNSFGMAATAVRASNAMFYTSPSFSGVTVNVMLQQNNAQTSASVGDAGKSSANGLSVNYAGGPLAVGFGLGTEKGSATNRAAQILVPGTAAAAVAATPNTKYTGQALSATYDLGAAKIYFGYSKAKDDNDTTADGGEVTIKETNFGVSVPMGAVTLLAGVGKNKATVNAVDGSLSGTDVVVGATYSLSKRTTAYFKTGTYGKFKGTIDATAVSMKTTRTSAGLRHTF